MEKGLFNLTAFESADADATIAPELNILDEPITESEQEFDTKSPAAPAEHFDANNSGEKDVAPKPAEKPAAKPANGEMGPVNPNSISETPSAKPYDTASISVPQGATLTASEYNNAIKQLQQSFKEAADICEALQTVTVVQEASIDEFENLAMDTVLEMAETKPAQLQAWLESVFGEKADMDKAKEAADAKKEKDAAKKLGEFHSQVSAILKKITKAKTLIEDASTKLNSLKAEKTECPETKECIKAISAAATKVDAALKNITAATEKLDCK